MDLSIDQARFFTLLSAPKVPSLSALRVYDSDQLVTLDLASLKTVTGSVDVYRNGVLLDLSGLGALESVGGNLQVYDNSGLRNIDGLTSLTGIGGSLSIRDNPSLRNLDGLSSLSGVASNVTIESNNTLPDLHGLLGLSSIGGGLSITKNSYLRDCQGLSTVLTGYPDESGVSGSVTISGADQPTTCDTVEDVLLFSGTLVARPAYCQSSGTIGITTQAQVDGFQEAYGPCDRVQKSLTISNSNNNTNDITNLDGLSGLKAVDGSLSLSYLRNLSGLSGLSNISEVGGTLTFGRDLFVAVGLEAFDREVALSQLTRVGGSLLVQFGRYESLRALRLPNLSEIGVDFRYRAGAAILPCYRRPKCHR